MKLRLPGRRAQSETPDTSADLSAQLAGVGKGRPTPKRAEAQGRRQGPPPPPPTTRKQAYKRMRETETATRGTTRAAAARGDERALPARDRGPERRLVRDVVDTRRNVGSVFLVIAVLALVSMVVRTAAVQAYSTLLLLAFFLLMVIDSVVLGRRIKRMVSERFPNTAQGMRGLIWYGISRSTMIRRWRFPKPQVAADAEI